MKLLKPLLVSFLFISFLLLQTKPLFAQTAESVAEAIGSLGIARLIKIADKDVKDGSIISATNDPNGAKLTTAAYDPQVIGIVARDAAILIESEDSDGLPVISSGAVYVLVSAKNGAIKKGDLLASSTTPGVAIKADQDGYVLGSALEDADPNPNTTDKIAAEINLHYYNSKPVFPGSLTDILKIVLLPTREGPSAWWKYIVAAIVLISSIILGFMTFGRTAAKGVEALGRNPAAGRIIHLGIIFNVIIVITIIAAGLTIAFLILRL
ncbi:MAG TPA: hypothetical protein VLF20_05420 [Patescibacteria group bacterium]|nr:hypothetical protein [Patescibacteria group bacterium]